MRRWFHARAPANRRPWPNMRVVTYHAIVFYGRRGVDDDVLTQNRSGVDDRAGH